MMKAVWSGIAAAARGAGCGARLRAGTDPATIIVTVNVNAKAKLTLGAAGDHVRGREPRCHAQPSPRRP